MASEPERPAFRQNFRDGQGLLNPDSFNQLGSSLQGQICRAVDLIEAPHNPKAETHKPMQLGALLSNGQSFKQRDDSSSMLSDVPANCLSEAFCPRHRHTAGSHTQMAYTMPLGRPFALNDTSVPKRPSWRYGFSGAFHRGQFRRCGGQAEHANAAQILRPKDRVFRHAGSTGFVGGDD